MHKLVIRAGPTARQKLLSEGWSWDHFDILLGASGGPKWLVLSALDQFLIECFAGRQRPLHLLGSSSGAYRFLAYIQREPARASQALRDAYIEADWTLLRPLPARRQTALGILQAYARPTPLLHPAFRMHVSTALCRGWLSSEGVLHQTLAIIGATLLGLIGRPHMKRWVERLLFSDPRSPLPSRLQDLSSHRADLTAHNLLDAVLASGSIPLVLPAEWDIDGAPRGAVRDGGLVDYHFDRMELEPEGLVLLPHFNSQLQPGWLERWGPRRPPAPAVLDRMVLIGPHPDWSRALPGGKIPDRQDANKFDKQSRRRNWHEAARRSQELAEELAAGGLESRILPL